MSKRVTELRNAVLVLSCLMTAAPVRAGALVTIAQLEQFLASKQAGKESDAEIAERLNGVTLSQQLAGPALARILAETNSRPAVAEQDELLAAESIFTPAPSIDEPQDPAPDSAMRQRMIEEAGAYVNGTLHVLPDFLAVRVTRSFANTITDLKPKHGKPKIEMHSASENRREIAYRDGHEVKLATPGRSSIPGDAQSSGLTTWGEFGGILQIVLKDAFNGSVEWERWQRSETGEEVAVFRYVIPGAASHFAVDFCCYQMSREDPVDLSFTARPGYHGELFVDPRDGSIDRITVEADLKAGDPVRRSAIAVQYGRVEIAGKPFVCPIRGVAISETHNLMMESIDGVGLERHTNLVTFVGYHKFGSTVRIMPQTIDK